MPAQTAFVTTPHDAPARVALLGGGAFEQMEAAQALIQGGAVCANLADAHAAIILGADPVGPARAALAAKRHVLIAHAQRIKAADMIELAAMAERAGLIAQGGATPAEGLRRWAETAGLFARRSTPVAMRVRRTGTADCALDLLGEEFALAAALFGFSPLHIDADGVSAGAGFTSVRARLEFIGGDVVCMARIAQSETRSLAVECESGSGATLSSPLQPRRPALALAAFLSAIQGEGPCPAPLAAAAGGRRLAERVADRVARAQPLGFSPKTRPLSAITVSG